MARIYFDSGSLVASENAVVDNYVVYLSRSIGFNVDTVLWRCSMCIAELGIKDRDIVAIGDAKGLPAITSADYIANDQIVGAG